MRRNSCCFQSGKRKGFRVQETRISTLSVPIGVPVSNFKLFTESPEPYVDRSSRYELFPPYTFWDIIVVARSLARAFARIPSGSFVSETRSLVERSSTNLSSNGDSEGPQGCDQRLELTSVSGVLWSFTLDLRCPIGVNGTSSECCVQFSAQNSAHE